jgi:ubiquinone/menaquinone biosynthesis C-methylase UbiE
MRIRTALALGSALVWGWLGIARASEIDRIVEVLAIHEGAWVADVGAGDGQWTEWLARRVGPGGHVFATEVSQADLGQVADRVRRAGLNNVTTVLGDQTSTGLPDACCDAVLLRMVYHHFTDPPAMRAALYRALRPGAHIAVVDIEPQKYWGKLPGVPDRGGHGIPQDDLIHEMTAAGFELLSHHPDWNADSDRYCVVFRRPPAGTPAVP